MSDPRGKVSETEWEVHPGGEGTHSNRTGGRAGTGRVSDRTLDGARKGTGRPPSVPDVPPENHV